MRRTNIYLSEQEQKALDAVAEAQGSNRSDVLRSIVDRELGLTSADPTVDRELGAAADAIARRGRSLFSGDPDLTTE